VLRYVERNPVRPALASRADEWRWSSLWRWRHPAKDPDKPPLCPRPIARPADWVARVNRAISKKELEALRLSVVRGRPFGDQPWQTRTAKRLRLESTFRPRSRPKKTESDTTRHR
jgi:putative transposase